jgi:hypothetical protein
MTFEEYAVKNIREMKAKEPTAQNMRDVALLELWLEKNTNQQADDYQIKSVEEKPRKELLPSYYTYIDTKQKYQHKDVTKEKTLDVLNSLSQEIKNFLLVLYRNTDTPEEREILNNYFCNIFTKK